MARRRPSERGLPGSSDRACFWSIASLGTDDRRHSGGDRQLLRRERKQLLQHHLHRRGGQLPQWVAQRLRDVHGRSPDKFVYDTDFIDPDIQSGDAGDDTFNFDQNTIGTAYVCLHGTCNDMPGDTCRFASDCQSGGVCIADAPPNNTAGHCAYYQDRYMITTADAYGNNYGGWINYSAGLVKWGETTASGGWAGAGTNGGLNFALLSNSCGIRPGFDHQQDTAIFAGVPVLGIIMPTTYGSDDVDAPTRGTALSNAFVTNSSGSIAHAWTSSLAGIPFDDGGPCGDGDYTYGGGHGIGGCGAQLSQSMDVNQSASDWDLNTMSWTQIPYQSLGSAGTEAQSNTWTCNYDCTTYPFTL
jgi:hypothetical protein